ncbi:MAG TPA: cyclodeaminase/cyclohydrolase family protein [Acidimicrobiales bacterium]|nr:cyclodeaminase/cyclohydrolase family protein [Acidimicrobiales bacterium]
MSDDGAAGREALSVGDLLGLVAARTPAPGGGAVGALAAACAAALVGMVCSYTIGERWIDRQERMAALSEEAAVWRVRALALVDEDERAFAAVGAAYAMPAGTDDEASARRGAVQRALVGAAVPPVHLAEVAGRIVEAADELAGRCNPNVRSDVGTATALADAAIMSAIVNITANMALISDGDEKARLSSALERASESATQARTVTRRVIDSLAS